MMEAWGWETYMTTLRLEQPRSGHGEVGRFRSTQLFEITTFEARIDGA